MRRQGAKTTRQGRLTDIEKPAMPAAENFTDKAAACLRDAAAATCMNERSRLIGEAAAWHMKAQEARDPAAASGGLAFDDDLIEDPAP